MIGVAQRHRMTGMAISAVCKVMNYSHYFQLIFKTFIGLKCVFFFAYFAKNDYLRKIMCKIVYNIVL